MQVYHNLTPVTTTGLSYIDEHHPRYHSHGFRASPKDLGPRYHSAHMGLHKSLYIKDIRRPGTICADGVKCDILNKENFTEKGFVDESFL